MVDFKACPRCHGDVYAVQDIYGEYIHCLQCGHVVDVLRIKRDISWSKGKQRPGRPKKRISRRNAA